MFHLVLTVEYKICLLEDFAFYFNAIFIESMFAMILEDLFL